MSKLFTARPTIEVDPRNPPELYAPQAVVVKGVRADGLFYKVDIGRICYLERDEDSGYSSGGKHHSFGLVSTDSLSSERVSWLRNYLDCAFRKGWRDETLRGRLHYIRYFFQFCDFNEGAKPTTLSDLVNEYKRYHMTLDQRARMGGASALGITALNGRLNSARSFIQWGGQLSSNEILKYIPKHRYRKSKIEPEARTINLKDGQDYLRACAVYFSQFSDAILGNKYPIRVTPPNTTDNDLYWHSPRGSTLKSLPNCFDVNGNPLPKKEVEHIISKNFKSKSIGQGKRGFYERTLVFNRDEWRGGKLTFQKVYAYNLSVFCFFQVFLGFTAANIQTALDLKISDIDLSVIGSGSFARKHKFRAGRSVEFSSSSKLKKEFLRYLKLREWVESLELFSNVDDYLFVKIGEDQSLKRLERGSGTWLIRQSPLFRNISMVSSRDVRQLSGEYFIRKSKGKVSLVAKKLNNSIATIAKSYTSVDLESQAIEMNGFHEEVSYKVRMFNRETAEPISVKFANDCRAERIATGSCSNLSGHTPLRREGFNAEAPEPACGTFESCLFCEYFAIHLDFEDIHKILSLREALRITSLIRNDPEHFEAVVQPALFRIEEIVAFVSEKNRFSKEVLCKAEEEVEMGKYNVHWDRQIKALSARYNELLIES
ncbi:hypothetical protein [Halomonas colorata]|uniref:Uncharacterized protein n=1 Tax=Halomonas colorata TaxID=2742615 RepID=A0ABR9FWT1_9GAMM|nr:hypothetical protein [Halomonas colorata]MBE0463110.1 hypothetical protein [Halomonas colorata]